ncbi:hypothetical protein E6O75_ATG09086 [Venturia nashicola]|uniref:Uncharacterized protein n=1 Tax=Venturia nashicola TaxID=86259 RepID=A0A4Z1P321_9PEZI|nr:hypothetical protein E6O75_ATG09086 [Venturia nashicola]
MLYLFLVERVVSAAEDRLWASKTRREDRLYVFNFFGLLIPFVTVIILNLKYREASLQAGMCYIGINMIALIPLVAYDVLANIYLTCLFMAPLLNAYSFQHRSKTNNLRRTALRAFLGGAITLVSSVANLLALLILKGEQSWICLLCCNSDVLLSVVVLQWMASGDGPTVRASYPPVTRNSQAHPIDQATEGNRQIVVVSQAGSEEMELKEASIYAGATGSADPAMIMKTVCMTVESTREGSLAEEDVVEAQIVDTEDDSG